LCIERIWLNASGRSRARTTTVSAMIDHPHEPPMMLCKNTRTGPKMSISG
jgi:hypothetical protein